MTEDNEWFEFIVEAQISMLPTSESGRKSGITSGYMPNHNFGAPDNREMRIGKITVQNDEWIEPGETKNVVVHFAMPEGYVIDLKPGLVWRIQEGGNHVGNGKILAVTDSNS